MPLERVQLGPYQILDLIGQGKRGEVYVAHDTRRNPVDQQVAIKVLRGADIAYPGDEASEEVRQRWQRELRALTQLDHPHILPFLDYGEERFKDTPLLYLVMPFCAAGSFARWLQENRGDNPLSPQECAYFVQQAGAALQYLHDRQLIHRHVTPASFMLSSWRGEADLPDLLLTDFWPSRRTLEARLAGRLADETPTFMAPEQWEGRPVPATDQYALAVLAYQLLTGRTPFLGTPRLVEHQQRFVLPQPPSTFNTQLSLAVDTVILRALAKKAEERFSSISTFAAAFEEAILRNTAPLDLRDARITRKIQALPLEQQAESGEEATSITGKQNVVGRGTTGKHVVVVEGSVATPASEVYTEQKITMPVPVAVPFRKDLVVSPPPVVPRASGATGRNPQRRRALLVILLALVLATGSLALYPLAFHKLAVSSAASPTSTLQSGPVATTTPDTSTMTGTPVLTATATSTPAPTVGVNLPVPTPTSTVQITPTATATATPTPTPTPKPGSYTFEDGGTDGWSALGTGVSNVSNTMTRAEQGTHSLKATILYTSGQAAPYLAVQNSQGTRIPQPGQTVSVYIYPTVLSGSPRMQARLTLFDASHTAVMSPLVTLKAGTWNYLVFPIPAKANQKLLTCGVQFFTAPAKISWTLMLDNTVWH